MLNVETSAQVENLRLVRGEVTALAQHHVKAINLFHVGEDLSGIQRGPIDVDAFSYLLPDKKERDRLRLAKGEISPGSNATCVMSLLASNEFRPEANAQFGNIIARLESKRLAKALDTGDLDHGNPFTMGLLLPALRQMNLPASSKLVRECMKFARRAVSPHGVRIGNFPPSAYLTYWILAGLASWGEDVKELYPELIAWTRSEFHRQMALFESNADEDSDVFQLGYSLLVQRRFGSPRLHQSLLNNGLRIIFEAQLQHGIWEKKAPLFVYGRYGDAYCFSFELLSSLLHEYGHDIDTLIPFKDYLHRAFQWAQRNGDTSYGFPLWRSGHRHDQTRPESWATAEVYRFLQHYRRFLTSWMQKLILNSFSSLPATASESAAFDHFFTSDVTLPKENKTYQITNLLKERLCKPLHVTVRGVGQYSLSESPDARSKNRSGILYGPPGTGKTSFAEAIARYMGWPMIVINPSDFAAEGLQLIASTTSKIFDVLSELEDTVVFFDEMEEMVTKRDQEEGGSFEQRFLTTSLLPKLQTLSSRAKCIFLVATNYFHRMDDAAKREGRFDFRIQVLPPCYKEKVRMLVDSWDGAVPVHILTEIEEQKEKITWATRGEMLSLISQLKVHIAGLAPLKKIKHEIRQRITDFNPVLQSKDYEGDSASNEFPMR